MSIKTWTQSASFLRVVVVVVVSATWLCFMARLKSYWTMPWGRASTSPEWLSHISLLYTSPSPRRPSSFPALHATAAQLFHCPNLWIHFFSLCHFAVRALVFPANVLMCVCVFVCVPGRLAFYFNAQTLTARSFWLYYCSFTQQKQKAVQTKLKQTCWWISKAAREKQHAAL